MSIIEEATKAIEREDMGERIKDASILIRRIKILEEEAASRLALYKEKLSKIEAGEEYTRPDNY